MTKWFVAAALIVLSWLPAACSKKPAPVPAVAEQPYTVTKTGPKAAPVVKAKPKPKPVKHRPAPTPAKQEACTVLGIFPC